MTLQTAAATAGMLAVAGMDGGMVYMMACQLLAAAAAMGAYFASVRRLVSPYDPAPRWDGPRAREVVQYGAKTALVTVGGVLFSNADKIVAGIVLDPSALGVYGVITSVVGKINSFSGTAVRPLLPAISGIMAAEKVDRDVLERRVGQAARLNAALAAGLGIAVLFGAPYIMEIASPSLAIDSAITLLRVGAVIYGVYSFSGYAYHILLGIGSVLTCAAIQFTAAALSLVLIYVGSMEFGLPGAVAGNAGFLVTGLFNIIAYRRIGVSLIEWLRNMSVPFFTLLLSSVWTIAFRPLAKWSLAGGAAGLLVIAVWYARSPEMSSLLVRIVPAARRRLTRAQRRTRREGEAK